MFERGAGWRTFSRYNRIANRVLYSFCVDISEDAPELDFRALRP